MSFVIRDKFLEQTRKEHSTNKTRRGEFAMRGHLIGGMNRMGATATVLVVDDGVGAIVLRRSFPPRSCFVGGMRGRSQSVYKIRGTHSVVVA